MKFLERDEIYTDTSDGEVLVFFHFDKDLKEFCFGSLTNTGLVYYSDTRDLRLANKEEKERWQM